jgi:hypothetical protein
MITVDFAPRGLHPRSEIRDQLAGHGRALTVEWAAQL